MRLWFGRVRRMRAPDYATAIEVLALAVWVEVALRAMPFSRMLERRGVASRVCFGVAKSGSALDAHAWVECDGVTRDSGSLHFTALAPPAEELPHVVNEQLRFL